MTRLDVSIQSFRKPESLIFTLLTLHHHCRDVIGTVWIGDDMSGAGIAELYHDPALQSLLAPWHIVVHPNHRRVGWSRTNVTPAMAKQFLRPGLSLEHWLRMAWGLLRGGFVRQEDIRYQNGLSQSQADYMLVLHDDVEIFGDVAGYLLSIMSARPELAITGQLGQCWRCGFRDRCSPSRLLDGYRPGPDWPLTPRTSNPIGLHRDRACRINEWCCMLNMQAVQALANENVFFGNCEDGGDTGAFWFAKAVASGWHFDDPFLRSASERWFQHGWQGHPGHSIWVDHGTGKAEYDATTIRTRLQREFDFIPENGWPSLDQRVS